MADNCKSFHLHPLEIKIGYAFDNIELLNLALTHRSYGTEHNERLEYLGDSILGMIIAKKLFDLFPKCPEGDLTRMRSTLVRETTLAEIAREFNLGNFLRLGPGELKTGGSRRDSLLADAVESIIGAIFLDTNDDFDRVKEIVLSWFDSRLATINPKVNQKDPKSTLQELLQSRHFKLPIYTVDNITGSDNNQTFYVSVSIEFIKQKFSGCGSSRRKAEQLAAQQALDFIKTNKLL